MTQLKFIEARFPTPQHIRKACGIIQRTWTRQERQKRREKALRALQILQASIRRDRNAG